MAIYQQIVTCLKTYGVVLTEHVAFPELELCQYPPDATVRHTLSIRFFSRKIVDGLGHSRTRHAMAVPIAGRGRRSDPTIVGRRLRDRPSDDIE